ncbi:MAG: hypothetical protein EOO46_11125 [Flavobacterium sp.]|nr:MAG: hypothetical protein EOO46_11125 [Flavobacterium sp.]
MIVDTEPNLLLRNQNIIELPAQMVVVNDAPVYDDNLHHDDDSDEESYDDSDDDDDDDSDDEYPDYSGRTTNCNIVNETNDTFYFVTSRGDDCDDRLIRVTIPHGKYHCCHDLEEAYQANGWQAGGCLQYIDVDDETGQFTFTFAQPDGRESSVNWN